jgi:endonuclease YncB( thermonuclease family)
MSTHTSRFLLLTARRLILRRPTPPDIAPFHAILLAAMAALALAGTACTAGAQIALTPDCKLESGPVRAVARVLDGETVRLDDASEVRLVGTLAPRAIDVGAAGGDWPPAEAARQALAWLVQGRSVALAFGGRRTDRYGRWLAHLVVERDGNERWVQGDLLEQGMARAYATPDNSACVEALLARERIARNSGRGLWLNAAYQIRSADQHEELLAYRHTFQLVAGRVERVTARRGQIYLDFGARDRAAYSVVVHAANGEPALAEMRALQGRTVLVRGWLDRRTGPIVELHGRNLLELAEQQSPDADRSRVRQ